MTDIIIQARMGSERLPGKVLMPLMGKPMLLQVIERARKARLVDRIIVATTELPIDDAIVEVCEKNGIEVFRGSENNVLDRFYQCITKYNSDIVIRLTADNALIDYSIIDESIEYLKKNEKDYVYYKLGLPLGTVIETFRADALKKAWKLAEDDASKEHVTFFIYTHGDLFNYEKVPVDGEDKSYIRLTMDTPEDYELVTRIYSYLNNSDFLLEDIYKLFEQNPELLEINKNIVQKVPKQ